MVRLVLKVVFARSAIAEMSGDVFLLLGESENFITQSMGFTINPLSPLSDPSNDALNRSASKANS